MSGPERKKRKIREDEDTIEDAHDMMKRLARNSVDALVKAAVAPIPSPKKYKNNIGVLYVPYYEKRKYMTAKSKQTRKMKQVGRFINRDPVTIEGWRKLLGCLSFQALKKIGKLTQEAFTDDLRMKNAKFNIKIDTVHFIAAIIMQEHTSGEKRALEKGNMTEYMERSLDSWDFPSLVVGGRVYSLPGEMFGLIFSFFPLNRSLLDTVGCVCELWYCLALKSFTTLTYRRVGTSKCIPMMVLHRFAWITLFFFG